MMAGVEDSDVAIEHARELLGQTAAARGSDEESGHGRGDAGAAMAVTVSQ
jgi:hypothetical protein